MNRFVVLLVCACGCSESKTDVGASDAGPLDTGDQDARSDTGASDTGAHRDAQPGEDATADAGVVDAGGQWRVLPIRSEAEFNAGRPGGEGEQHPHGMARSPSDPNRIYLSHDVAGTWRSEDGGDTWKKCLDRGLTVHAGQSIMVDPADPLHVLFIADNSYNYLADGYEGLFRSTNGGDDWTRVLQVDTHYDSSMHRIFRNNIVADPSSVSNGRAQRWYVAFPQLGIYRSEDAGVTWTAQPVSSLNGHDISYGLYSHPTDGQTIYLASDQGLFVSSDRGATLDPLGDLPQGAVSSLAVHPTDPQQLYATVRDVGLFHSTNGGTTFTSLRAFDAARVFINPGHPQTLYLVGLSSNTLITHDAGGTWIEDMVTEPAPGLGRDSGSWKRRIAGGLSGIVPNPNDANEAVAFSRATIWKTTDGGQVFVDSSSGFTGFAWSWWNGGATFDPNDPDRFAFFNCDVGMTITTNGGDWFERRNDQAWGWYSSNEITWIGAYAGSFQPIQGSPIMVASVGGYFRTKLMVTSDEGRTWSLVPNQENEQNLFISFHPNDPNLVYAGSRISSNAGTSFSSIDFGTYASLNPAIHGMCQSDPDTVYAIDEDRNTILRSDDRAQTWTEYVSTTWTFRRLDSLPTFAADPGNCDKVWTIDATGDLASYDGQWHSTGVLPLSGATDYGNHVRSVAVDPQDGQVLYAGMFSTGVPCIFRSRDGGTTWQDITENLPRLGISAMTVNPHTRELYRGSAFGTWIYPAPE